MIFSCYEYPTSEIILILFKYLSREIYLKKIKDTFSFIVSTYKVDIKFEKLCYDKKYFYMKAKEKKKKYVNDFSFLINNIYNLEIFY